MKYLEEIAEIWKEEITKSMLSVGLKDSEIINDFKVVPEKNGISIYLPDYSKYIESGRKPNLKQPPFKVILTWVKRKGFTGNLNSIAFAIAKSIAKNGIRPRPFLENASTEALEQTSLYLDKYLEKEINKLIE